MAELADAPDLGSGVYDVQEQAIIPAPKRRSFHQEKAATYTMLT